MEVQMKKVIFYGAGKNAQQHLNTWLYEGLQPVCFVDRNKKKHGSCFCGYEVISLSNAIERYPDVELFITLAPSNQSKVIEYLLECGIQLNVFFPKI